MNILLNFDKTVLSKLITVFYLFFEILFYRSTGSDRSCWFELKEKEPIFDIKTRSKYITQCCYLIYIQWIQINKKSRGFRKFLSRIFPSKNLHSIFEKKKKLPFCCLKIPFISKWLLLLFRPYSSNANRIWDKNTYFQDVFSWLKGDRRP